MKDYVFFLGGHDLEMLAIRDFITSKGTGFYDAKLTWGAKASDYKTLIELAHSDGRIPVLVELEVDFELPTSAIVIDHHGDRSEEPASLIQVIVLLGEQPSKWQLLIASNDTGYIPAMVAMGASDVEIRGIRRADREAQGVTKEMEEDAEYAIKYRKTVDNGVTIVRIRYNKCSPVTDRLFTSWENGKENLLVVCELPGETQEVNYFGPGHVCKQMKEAFVGGWGGGKGYGNVNGQGFAGCRTPNTDKVVRFVIEHQN